MDRIKPLNTFKLFRNKDVKAATIKFIIILIVGWISITISCKLLVKDLSRILFEQNSVIASSIINNKSFGTIIKGFYEKQSEEDLANAREELNSYGYNEGLMIENNEIVFGFYKKLLYTILTIFTVVVGLVYVIYYLNMKKIYSKLNKITKNISDMSSGNYKEIEFDYTEGEFAILATSLNYIGDRVNNSINLLQEEKTNMKDFLADISHQLKTPLASLVMFNDLLKEEEKVSKEDRIKFIEKSDNQLRRMEWLIMNLLKVGRLQAGAITFKMEDKSAIGTINMALDSLRNKADFKNQIIITRDEKKASFRHDRLWLSEAISNIIKNSIENTPYGGIIKIDIIKGTLSTKIIIRDNGCGIPKEMQEKIFKRFYKGNNNTNPESIGIGLSLAKSIIEEQNGEIRLFSEKDKGSKFIITFYEEI